MVNKLLILSESMFHCHSSQLLLATYGFTEKVDGPGKIGTQIFVLMINDGVFSEKADSADTEFDQGAVFEILCKHTAGEDGETEILPDGIDDGDYTGAFEPRPEQEVMHHESRLGEFPGA